MKQWFLLSLILLCGCSLQKKKQFPKKLQGLKDVTIYSRKAKPIKSISLQKMTVYSATKKYLIGQIGDIAVDDSGRIFIADTQKMEIDVFSPDGDFIRSLGRIGKGPSEFLYIKSLQITNNHLYAYDSDQFRVNIFSLDNLAKSKTIFLGRNRSDLHELNKVYPKISKLYVRNNGTYIAEFIADSSQNISKWQSTDMVGLLYLLNKKGMIISKIFNFITGTRTLVGLLVVPIKPFFGDGMIALSGDNQIYWAGPDYFLVKIYSPTGLYQRSFYYPFKKVPLTRKTAVNAGVRDLYIQSMGSMKLPKYWPVLTRIKIDDQGRLWIATTIRNMKVYQWWVLKPNGQLICRFKWLRSKPIQIIKNGYLYTLETEEGTGMEQVVKYRFEID